MNHNNRGGWLNLLIDENDQLKNMPEIRPMQLQESHGGDDCEDGDVEMDYLSETSSAVSVVLRDQWTDSDIEYWNTSPHTSELRPDTMTIENYVSESDVMEHDQWTDSDVDYNDTSPHTSEIRPITLTTANGVDESNDNLSEIPPERISQCLDNEENIGNQNSVTQDQTGIVEIKYIFKQVQSKTRHTGSCHFEDMIFQTEVKKGINSMYKFECGVCGVKQNIWSCNDAIPVSVNEAAVLGITAVGLGSYHLNEFCTNLEIPNMSNYMYDKTQKKQQHDWWELAKKEASDALLEEVRLAKLNGSVDSKGNALITVVCDGSWPKRSYNHNFTSLSGCAVIIGMRTNKVIYFDVKDKYCHVCKIAQSKNVEPKEHECNTNYKGASSSMETTIVVEGFQYCETLGARFNEFVADGDSSTFKTICDQKVYQNPDIEVEKDDCCNHLYRNFRKAFGKLGKATRKFKLQARKYITKKKANDICLGVQSAAKHWRNSSCDTITKLVNLEKDVLNAPMHYFGIHDDCEAYYCSKTTEPEAKVVVAMLKSDGIFNEILNLCLTYFASSVPSLLLNYNNNMAESFNNLIAKYTGGKRINYCLAKSYRSRVARAVVQYNTDGCSGSTYHKYKGSNTQLETLEKCRKQKTQKNMIVKKMKPPTARFCDRVRETDKGIGYGPHCQTNDMLPQIFEIAKNNFMESLVENQENSDFINRSTLGQNLNRKWRDMRKKLLTSFYFSEIVNARSRKTYKSVLEDIMKNTEFSNSAENRHQKLHQQKALNCFSLLHTASRLSECGLIIDEEICFLATSPYRLYADNGIVVIKCPLKPYKKTIQEALDENLIPLYKMVSGVETLNTKSAWYIEIQGQLHVAHKSIAYVVIWLESEFKFDKILRDDDFWIREMEEPLVYFYQEVMIKELVNPRKKRNMPYRAYNPVTKTFE